MKRKLVQQGTSTLMISLPNKWIKTAALQKGNEVIVQERDGNVVISPLEVSEKTTTILIKNNTESSIRTAIVNAYRLGYTVIHLQIENMQQVQVVKNIIQNYLMGIELVEESFPHLTLRIVSEPSQKTLELFIKKIFSNTSLLIKGTQRRLSEKSSFSEYKEISFKIHQYDNCCRRIISKNLSSYPELEAEWAFLSLMVHGQRELYLLNNHLDKY